MSQLEDALTQVAKLKADLSAANKATGTAQALADRAVQERDAAKTASGELSCVWRWGQRASRAHGQRRGVGQRAGQHLRI